MEHYFTWQDTKICYRTEGAGTAVVLLHGFAEGGDIWDEQLKYLQSYFRVIVPDLPGSGRSGTLQKTSSEVTIADYADCIYALLAHEQISRCILLGHSMGGYITLYFAEKYPQLLQAFGLVHSTAFADSEEKKQNRLKGIKLMEEYGAYAFIKTTTPNLFAAKFKQEHAEKIAALVEAGKQFTTTALQQYYRAMMNRTAKTSVLSGSKFPVLFISGEEDVAAPLTDILQQVHLPEIAYIHILNNTGHMGIWESTDKVNSYLYQFCSKFE